MGRRSTYITNDTKKRIITLLTRFSSKELSNAKIAKRTDVSLSYVCQVLKEADIIRPIRLEDIQKNNL